MAVIGLDLGGTKLAGAVFSENGDIIEQSVELLDGRTGPEVGALITGRVGEFIGHTHEKITAIGVSVPGISRHNEGTVWAPNIPGWTDYPLHEELKKSLGNVSTTIAIESDRSCYILGETWRGSAVGCKNAVFLAVGTGIGAGVVIDGVILRGAADIAGSIGWMALDRPYKDEYIPCGCFEYYASGEGVSRTARFMLNTNPDYTGELRDKALDTLSCRDVFIAFEHGDTLASRVFDMVIELWGMAAANCVSLFNPDTIVFGGGVFGPAVRFIDRIYGEAKKWAQPIAIRQVTFTASQLGDEAGLYGAGRLALNVATNIY